MSIDHDRRHNRFSATTSCFLLPTFRHPDYSDIVKTNIDPGLINPTYTFYRWTLENDSSVYKTVNDALLRDDYSELQKHMDYINRLGYSIQTNVLKEPVKVYWILELDPTYVLNECKENQAFLWLTFSSISRNKDIASKFGNYTFEINASSVNTRNIHMKKKYCFIHIVDFV